MASDEVEKFVMENYCRHCSNFFTCLGYEGCTMKDIIEPELKKWREEHGIIK